MHPPRRLRRAIVMYLAGACVLVAAEAIAPGEVHGVSPSSREAGARSPEAALGAPNAVPLPAPFRAVRPSIPPPTPEGPGNSPSPFPTVLHTPQTASHTPRMAAPEAILEDLDTGQILFERNPDSPRPIASLTKIMTALLVLRGGEPTGAATVSAAAAAQNGSTLGLRPGERPSVLALLYALMLQSSNDAAVALAENAAGTSARFVELMNRRAAALGLRHTRYFSPSGLDDRGYSTARDLAAVTRTADQVPLFQSIVATRTRDIPAPAGPPRHIQNRNVLLWLYPGATGVKTGSTPGAGSCLVATARQGARGLVAVVLA